MKLFITASLLLTSIMGCTSKTTTPTPNPISTIGCDVETSLSSAFATSLSGILSCTNTNVIQTDLLGYLGKANLCAQSSNALIKSKSLVSPKGVIGGIICPIAVQSAMAAVGTKTPVTWGCNPAASTGSAASALTTVCLNLVNL